MSGTDKQLRTELVEARDRIRRELEILQAPSSIGNPPDNGGVIAELEAELSQIEDALAGR
jgi:hypothetical protein